MLRTEVAGVPLSSFADPIATALSGYSALTDGDVVFDPAQAIRLERTPDKPNSARSVSPVKLAGVPVGDLVVIVFGPGDGTGDESKYKLNKLDELDELKQVSTGILPRNARVLPRSKATTDTETHLTIATSVIDGGRDPVMYAGNLAVLGIEGRNVVNIGCVGQRMIEYQWGLAGWSEVPPTATLTAGYTVRSQFSNQPIRFGDPHAIYNPHPRDVQVCGFIATQNGGTQADIESRRDLFTMLGALPFGPDNA